MMDVTADGFQVRGISLYSTKKKRQQALGLATLLFHGRKLRFKTFFCVEHCVTEPQRIPLVILG